MPHVDKNQAAHDDEVALGQVLDVHHPPDKRQAVSRKGEDGADEKAVQKQLHIENRRLSKQGQIIHHGRDDPE